MTYALSDLETWRLGDLETWRLGDLETWRLGDLETWRLGDLAFIKSTLVILFSHTPNIRVKLKNEKFFHDCNALSIFQIRKKCSLKRKFWSNAIFKTPIFSNLQNAFLKKPCIENSENFFLIRSCYARKRRSKNGKTSQRTVHEDLLRHDLFTGIVQAHT